MAKPLDDERFRKLQRDAEIALESRPDLSATVQRSLEAAIEELKAVVLKPRTQPTRGGDPQKGPEVAVARQQIGVLEMWLRRIVNQRPVEAIRVRIEAARRAGMVNQTATAIREVRDTARAQDLVALRKMLADVDDPQKPDTAWVNRGATRAFLKSEIAEIESMLDAIK